MCGIFGYIGNKKASPILLDGLKKLEYRGYDSAGIATINGNKIEIRKDVGKVDEIDSKINFKEMEGNIGVGHTRWATHGGVTKNNSHPHISNNGKILVVHNGIIENFQSQQKFLIGQGFSFYSQTDTEPIPNTIEYQMKKGYDFVEAAKRSLSHLEGQHAIVAIHQDEKTMVAVRRDAPL